MNSMQERASEVSDVFNASFESAKQKHRFTPRQLAAASHIMGCRTSRMGAFIYRCEDCSNEYISYCSCRDRMCPKCQSQAHHKWINKISGLVLDCNHLHAVVTVPADFNPIALANKELFYSLMFQTASEAVLMLCSNPKHLGAMPGITAILHTWGQKLDFHPHIHMAVTAGGIASDGRWVDAKKTKNGDIYLFPVKALSEIVKKRLLKKLRAAKKKGLLLFDDKDFKDALKKADSKKWISYIKEPFKGSDGVFAYIGNYTHRSAISNSRIKEVTETHTVFQYRDYSDGNKQKLLTLENEEFIRRFLMHALKSGFVRIRHYGLYSVPNRKTRLADARRSLSGDKEQIEHKRTEEDKEARSVPRCPCCGGIMIRCTSSPLSHMAIIDYIHRADPL